MRAASSPEAREPRGGAGLSHAGSWRGVHGWDVTSRRCAWLGPAFERLDDDHAPAARWAWRGGIDRFPRHVIVGRRCDPEQLAGTLQVGLAGGTGEQAVMADTVEALGQDMEQEAADELVRAERHDLLPGDAFAAIVFVAEGDAGLVEADEPAVGDGHAVSVARQIGEHRLGAGERRPSTTLALCGRVGSARSFSQCGHRSGGGLAKRSRMACLMAGMLGCGGGAPTLFFPTREPEAARLEEGVSDHAHQGMSV